MTGLAMGSIPFILMEKAPNFAKGGVFKLAQWPYSLKLLWSPIVDSVFSTAIGRRKSWIVPLQAIVSVLLFLMSYFLEDWLEQAALVPLTSFFFLIVTIAATQDIAVDGWALTMLSKKNVPYASTAQTIGLTTGYFMSFSIMLTLTSDVACCGIFSRPAFFTISGYLKFWAVCTGVFTAFLYYFKDEPEELEAVMSPSKVYKQLFQVLRKPAVQKLAMVLVVSKTCLSAGDSLLMPKLQKLNVPKELFATVALVEFPFEAAFAYLTVRLSSTKNPLRLWPFAFLLRLVFGILGIGVVMFWKASAPELSASAGDEAVHAATKSFEVINGACVRTISESAKATSPTGPSWFFVLLILYALSTSLAVNVIFTSWGAFFTRIGDPVIGGTYLTLLNTISNLGGTAPQTLVMLLAGYIESSLHQDGYVWMLLICCGSGFMLMPWLVAKIKEIELYPESSWRIN